MEQATEDTTLEALYAKAQGAAAVEERAFELERELKTHPGNIGVQSEHAKPFTEAELTELDTLQGEKDMEQFQTGVLIGLVGIIAIIVVGFFNEPSSARRWDSATVWNWRRFFLPKNGSTFSQKKCRDEQSPTAPLSGKGIEVTQMKQDRFIRRNEGRSVNDFLQKKAQFVQLEQRLDAFKEESKDFWAKGTNHSPCYWWSNSYALSGETWMASQKRVAKLEQLQESILKKEHHLAQLGTRYNRSA